MELVYQKYKGEVMPTLEELTKMSVEELTALKTKLSGQTAQTEAMQKPLGILGGVGNAFLGGMRGDWREKPKDTESDFAEKINTLIATERLKQHMASQTPGGKLQQMEYDEAIRRQTPETLPPVTPSPVRGILPQAQPGILRQPSIPGAVSQPPSKEMPSEEITPQKEPKQFIDVMKWETDKYGSRKVPTSMVNPEYTDALANKQFRTQEEEKILAKGRSEQAIQMKNFETVSGILQQTVASWKAAQAEKMGMPALMQKHTAPIAGALALEGLPYTKAFVGQRIETAMMLSKIITGGSRIIKSVINQLLKTIPEDTGIEKDMEAMIKQSFMNSYARSAGRSLSPKERQEALSKIDEIITTTPAMGTEELTPIGIKTIEVDGVLYDVPPEEFEEFLKSVPDDAEMWDRTGA